MRGIDLDSYNKYRGRKFLLTAGTVLLTAVLSYYGKMNGDVALVFTGAIGTFNYALRNSG